MKLNSKFKKLIFSVLSAACVGTAAFGVAGCMPKSIDKTEPTDRNVRNDRLAPPTDGSLPTAYSAAENLAFVVGKFDTQTQFHSYTEGVTSASIATQVTRNWKDYKDGVLVNSDITFSSMVKGGTQTCTIYGKDEEGNPLADTYFRTSETPAQDTTSTSAVWKQDAPTYFSENAYLYTYGFLPNELFNYAVNSETIISSEEIKVESDGTYTLKVTLDPVGSTFYYQFGMKTRGGLSDFPEFKYIEITVNFDKNWQINSSSFHEVSNVNKGIVVSSTSDFTSEYYYGEDHFDNEHFGYYENYYKKFLGDSSLQQGGDDDGELVMDVTNVLSNGFATILNGGQQFEIDATLGKNRYVGYVFIGLDLADIAGSINLKASLGKTLHSQNFYVEYAGGELSAYYGEDFGLYANLAEVKLQAEQFGKIIEKITAVVSPSNGGSTEQGGASQNGASQDGGSDPLTALMDSMVLTADENQATLSLKTDDLLGLGIGVDANLEFGISGKTITFRGATIGGLSLGGETLDLNLGLKTTTAPLIGYSPVKTPADLSDYVADVYSLLSSDLIKVSAELNGDAEGVQLSALKGVNAKVDAYADLSGIALGADAAVSYTSNGNGISAKVGVIYEYNRTTGKYGKAYLSLKELNGTAYNVNVCCDVDELITGISALVQTAGNNAGAPSSLDTGKLIAALNSALSSDFSSLLTEMYADGSKIKIGVSVDTVLNMLGVDAGVQFGSCELAYARGQGGNGGNLTASLPSIGFSMGVYGAEGEITEPNEEDYLDLSDILTDIQAFLGVKTVAVGLSFDGSQFAAADIAQLKDLTANAEILLDLNSGLAAQVVAKVTYGEISAKITANYIYNEKTNGLVVLSLDELCGVERNIKVYCTVNEVVDGVKSLMTHFGTAQTTAETAANSGIDLSAVLAKLLTADINAIIPDLEAKANVLNLSVNVDEVLNLLGVDLGNLSVGEVALNYTHGGENLLSLNAPNFGVVATVNPYNEDLAKVTTDGALNLADVLVDVNSILNSKKLAVNLTFDGAQFKAANVEALKDLTANATVYADLNSNLTAQVVANVTYGEITAKITANYIYNKDTNGLVVLSLDELCGIKRNVKIYCNVNEVVDGVKSLMTHFGKAQTTAETAANGIDLNTVLANLLTADINSIIPNLEAKANVLNLSVNVDEVLNLLGVSVDGLSIGEVALNYTHGGKNLLSLNAPNFGVVATVNPYNEDLAEVTTDGALNLADVLADVNSILNSKKLAVDLTFDGSQFKAASIEALKDLTTTATVYVDLNSNLTAQVVASVTYGEITATITANYIYNEKTNGLVVLSLDELCGVKRSVKVYCNVNEVVEGVKSLMTHFGTAQTTAEGETSNGIDLSAVLAKLLTADINAIIPNLEAKANVLNLSVNVDEVLNLLGVPVDGLSIGEVALNYTHGGKNLLSLNAPNFGVVATVNPYNGNLPEASTENALNLADVLADVNSILNSKKLAVNLTFDGAQFKAANVEALKDLTASATVYADLNSNLTAQVVAKVAYGEISAKITANYIYNETTNGLVVLSLDELCGIKRNVKIYCNVNEVVDGVKSLMTHFGKAQTTAETAANGIDLNTVLANLLTADINSIIPNLEAKANVLNLSVNVDEVLNLLGVSVDGLSIGEVALNYTHGGENLLSVNAPNFGVVATVNPYNEDLAEVTTDGALNLADVLADVNSILNSKKLAVDLTFDGSQFAAADIAQLKNLTANATVYADLNSNLTAQVVANVTYGGITAQITANYIYNEKTNGLVVLSLDELCGVERNIKVYCTVNEVVDGVKSLMTHFGTAQTTAEGETSNGIDLNTVLANLLTADINAIIPNLEAKANVLNLSVNVDEVLNLLGVPVDGLSIGEVALNYTHGGKNLLSLNAPNFGVVATVNPYNGNLPEASTENALNLADVLADVNSILNSKKLAVNLTFDGAQFKAKDIAQLKNLTATATAFVDFNSGIAAQVNAGVSYKVDDQTSLTATLKVYFGYDSDTIGNVVVVLDSVNGVDTSVKVCCNVKELKTAIETLLTYVAPKNQQLASDTTAPATTESSTQAAASVLDTLISADFNKLLGSIRTEENLLNLTVNVDEILKLFKVDLGISLGSATLEYRHAKADETVDMLSATVENFGVSLAVNPTTTETTLPATDDCMDLSKLVGVVNGALSQIDTIKKDGKLYFEIAEVTKDKDPATYLYLDGIRVQVWGNGEICWLAGHERVALDLAMSISEEGTDVTTVKFVYDKNADPMVKLALNGVGLTIYKADIEGVKNGFTEIYNKLAELLGLQPITAQTAQPDQTAADQTGNSGDTQPLSGGEGTQNGTNNLGSVDNLLAVIFKVLAQDNWVNELNNFTATTDGKSVALGYLTDKNMATVNIGTEGGLALTYNGALGERFELGGSLKVTKAKELSVSFDGCNMASSEKGETEFIRLAYNFLFDCIHGITVENILGSSTYAVNFELNGANTEVADLKDVYVKAEIYVTDEASENNGKLAEGLLNLDVAGVAINLHVISEYDSNGKARFFINLTRVADILLPDLKLYATQDSLYETFKVLFNAVTKTDAVEVIKNLLPATPAPDEGAATQETPAGSEGSQPVVTEGTLDKVAKILDKVINLNFSKAIKAYETDGVQHADIDLDNLLGQLGVNVGSLGSLAVEIDHDNHAMTTTGVATVTNADGVPEEKKWISLSSEKTTKRKYDTFKREDYLSIEFLPTLLDDVVKFATDDAGKMYQKFTLSGNIEASIVSIFNIKIDVKSLTISIADNDFYFSAILHVQKMSALGIVTIPESTVGISFHGGYLTLARGIDSETPAYRIMTMDYFVDHMLVKEEKDSVLQWWLNVSGWDTVISVINKAAPDLNVSSGLTTPQDVYLYKQKKEGSTQLISMYDYVDALRVMVNGNEYASFGNMSDLEKEFGISDNYYGFMLNAKKVTGDVLTKLYAAIIRNKNGGLSTVKASGAIDTYVTFGATLNYEEGLKDTYEIGTAVKDKLNAPSMFTAATTLAGGKDKIDFGHDVKSTDLSPDEKFGCVTIAHDGTGYKTTYQHSYVLKAHTLTIVDLNNNETTMEVRRGSTVHLYDNAAPAYADEGESFRLLYTTEKDVLQVGENGRYSVTMDGDKTVYAIKIQAVNVIATTGTDENTVQHTITSFLGDKVPTEVEGLETIGKVTYTNGSKVGKEVGADDTITQELLKDAKALHISGVFVQSLVEVDGVNYKFTYDNEAGKGHYEVVGKAESFDTTSYCGDDAKTLVLQNEIGGYPVTAIAKEAFANIDGHALKRVIVPENIVTVGEGAFLNNIGMESVVFLAPQVTISGKFDEGEAGNTTPFYGCSATTDGTTTNLKIYYNSIVYDKSDANLLWTKFRRSGSGAVFDRYYIGCDPRDTAIIDYDHNGGGKLVSSGWSVVTLEVSAGCVDDGVDVAELAGANVTVGLRESVYTQEDGKALEQVITEALAQYKNEIGDAKYIVNVNVTNYYGNVTVSVSVSLNEPVKVSVYSDVPFKYTLNAQEKGTGNSSLIVIKTENGVTLYNPEATDKDHTFLGWAMNIDGTLTFIDGTDAPYAEGCVYYAIWGNSSVGTAFGIDGVSTKGTSLPTVSGEGIDGKWYDGAWNEVTDISLNNTVVYTRSKVTVSVVITGGSDSHTNFYQGSNDKGKQIATAQSAHTITVEVLQGSAITVEVTNNGQILNINGTQYCAYKTGSWGVTNKGSRTFTYQSVSGSEFNGNKLMINNAVTINYTI